MHYYKLYYTHHPYHCPLPVRPYPTTPTPYLRPCTSSATTPYNHHHHPSPTHPPTTNVLSLWRLWAVGCVGSKTDGLDLLLTCTRSDRGGGRYTPPPFPQPSHTKGNCSTLAHKADIHPREEHACRDSWQFFSNWQCLDNKWSIQYNTTQYNTIQYNTAQYRHNTTQCKTIQCTTKQYNTKQYNTM